MSEYFLNKHECLQAATFLRRGSDYVFPMNFAKFLRIVILQNHTGELFLHHGICLSPTIDYQQTGISGLSFQYWSDWFYEKLHSSLLKAVSC